jgi:hypothetical protein
LRLAEGFPAAFDGFLAGQPWAGPVPDGASLLEAMRRPAAFAAVLRRHAAGRLAAFDLSPSGGLAIGVDALLPLAASAQLELASSGPKGMVELARACAGAAAERGLARNLAEDSLCSLAALRLPPLPPPGAEETVKVLRRLSPWSLLDGGLKNLDDEQGRTAGEWLAARVLPAGRPGRFPLRKLLLQRLIAASDLGDPLPSLAALALILKPLAARGFGTHLADFYECYCGWLETRGRRDAHLRRVLKRLELRDVESELRREGVAAAAFFVLLGRLEPAFTRAAPRLHRDLLHASRDLARRLPETTP